MPESSSFQRSSLVTVSSRPSSVALAVSALVLAACAGSARGKVGASGDTSSEVDASASASAEQEGEKDSTLPAQKSATAPSSAAAGAASVASQELEPSHKYDPKLVREALDRTAEAPDERARLGARLSLVDQGPDAPWLLAIVNRGTEPIRVVPDLRTLSLTVTPPKPEVEPGKKAKAVREPKPVTCKLPRGLAPNEEDSTLSTVLEPGEGLVDSFDPRLYCLSVAGKSPLVPGASVVARLGWPEKTKTVWKKGKREQVVLEQSPPFLVRRLVQEGSLPARKPEPAQDAEKLGGAPHSDADGIKLLAAEALSLGSEYAPRPAPPDPEPLRLLLTRGSDAPTERDATISVALVNRGKKPERVFFRRELVSLEISGPAGMVTCDPGPDNRAPDRSSVRTLRPGARISATSRLIELCPEGALRRPGLYLIQGRFQGIGGASDPAAPPAFAGRLVSHEPVQVRVRHGWGPLPPQHDPERVRVGTP